MNSMGKLLVICGPTGVGKTSLGVRLAEKFDGELVSADSRQVYRGLDIATGKDLPVSSKLKAQSAKLKLKSQNYKVGYHLIGGVRVWMLDVVGPKDSFSVAHYHDLAHKVVHDIWRRGSLPILVGGTGFYIKALVDGIGTLGVPPSKKLRRAYKKKSARELFGILSHLDPEGADALNDSERKNRQRLIRRIEVAQVGLKKVVKRGWQDLDVLMVGLKAPREVLKERISGRIDKWVEEGVEEEVRNLLEKGVSWDDQVMKAIWPRQMRRYIEGEISREEAVDAFKRGDLNLAKRQMTWFARDKRIKWFDITSKNWEAMVDKLVGKWYDRGSLKVKVQSAKLLRKT